MANLDLYLDIAALRAVRGFNNPDAFIIPPFVAWDTITTRIRLLERTASFPVNPYSFVPTAGLTLQLAIGIDRGVGLSTQNTWVPSTNDGDPYFEAVVPLNTDGIVNATANGQVTAKLHIRKVGADGTKTVLLQEVTLVPGIITDSALVVPAPLTPLSLEAALAIFLQRVITGKVTFVCDTDSTKRRDLFTAPDGTFHEDLG